MPGHSKDRLELSLTEAFFKGGLWGALLELFAGTPTSWAASVPVGADGFTFKVVNGRPLKCAMKDLSGLELAFRVNGPAAEEAFSVYAAEPLEARGACKHLFELFVYYDSRLRSRLPSLFALLPGVDDVVGALNEDIERLSAAPVVFLSGKRYSGRISFAETFLRRHMGLDVDLHSIVVSAKDSGLTFDSRGFAFSSEAALLSIEAQEKILLASQKQKIFLRSEYALDPLAENQILISPLVEACKSGLVELRSNREVGLEMAAEIFRRFRGVDMRAVQADEKRGFYWPLVELFQNNERVPRSGEKLREQIKNLEVAAIEHAFRAMGNSQNRIAKFLGISRGSLQHKIKKYKLPYSEWDDG